MSKPPVTDISKFDLADESLPLGAQMRLVRFFGTVVSAASVLQPGEFQISNLPCRKRPKKRPCPGSIKLGRTIPADNINWNCAECGDEGVLTNWKGTRWDLSSEVKNGRLISISQARAQREHISNTKPHRVYEFVAELIGGPIPLDEVAVRRVRIAGHQTLHDLSSLLQMAFDREDEEPYEFLFGAAYDVDAQRYTGGIDSNDLFTDSKDLQRLPWETEQTTIDALLLRVGQTFGYLFDFFEEWVHRLTVTSISEFKGKTTAAAILEKIGPSPPQHSSGENEIDEDLFFCDLDEDLTLTRLYGPYLPNEDPDPADWLGMEELERLLLVSEAHNHGIQGEDSPVESMLLHSLVHCLAETRLAQGDGALHAQLREYQRHGIERHQAIHILGEQLASKKLRSNSTTTKPSRKNPSLPGESRGEQS
ncbi:MAG: hypothetical protein V1754_16020 [Pseudomonadota bacterium]